METFKIEHFGRENSNRRFPSFKQLNEEDCRQVRQALADRLRLNKDSEGLVLVNTVARMALPIETVTANDPDFDLKRVLSEKGITPNDSVYINWYRYDKIDKMNLEDLANNFRDIWYPSSDDIDICDDTFQWIMSVTHDGRLELVSLN